MDEKRDIGLEAHSAAEKHLDECFAWQSYNDGLGENGNGPAPEEDPASEPFCGCQTCMIRETLYAAWPVIAKAMGY